MNIVWFRRDLRVQDHLPLTMASRYGESLPLFIIEPSFWQNGIMSARHFNFVLEGLEDLTRKLKAMGGRLYFAFGEAEDVFQRLLEEHGPFSLYFHKDLSIWNPSFVKWIRYSGINYEEIEPIPEEISKLSKKKWLAAMGEQEETPQIRISMAENIPEWLLDNFKKLQTYHVEGEPIRFGQAGGEDNAVETLQSFLKDRHVQYLEGLESPLKASLYMSRLSPYLAWGNISMKSVILETLQILELPGQNGTSQTINAFIDNLYRREKAKISQEDSTPDLLSPYRRAWEKEELERFRSGSTGIPIVDASMECLNKTGWLPHNLRALIVSFACNTMLLEPGPIKNLLGSLFLDYDPDIHTHAFNLCLPQKGGGEGKIIDPVSAGKKLDKGAAFIRRHLPMLAGLPDQYAHEPWSSPGFYQLGCPVPMADTKKAAKHARGILKEASIKTKKDLEPGGQLFLDLFNEE